MREAFKEKKSVILNRLFIFLFSVMFIASLCLTINAVAEITGLKFETATIKEKSDNVDASITINNDEIENNVTFHKLNDYVIYNVTLKNNNDKDITISSIVKDSSTNEYVAYDFDQHKGDVVKAGENFSFDIKTTYTKEQTNINDRNQDIKAKFIINYLEGTEEKDTTVSINPKTNDEINMHLVLLFVSSTGLIISIIISKKNKHKESILFVIFGLIVTPFVVKAATLGCNISINATYNLNDKLLLTYTVDGEEKTYVVPYGEKIKDQEIPAKDGYIIGNWQDRLGNEYDLTENVTEDKELVATYIYNETPTIEITRYNMFTINSPNAAAYYVSTSPVAPINSDAQTEFALDTWTSSASTSELTLSEGLTYYVFIKDSNDNISINANSVPVRKIEKETMAGTNISLNIAHLMDMHYGLGFSNGEMDSESKYVLDGVEFTPSVSISAGFENLSIKRNGTVINELHKEVIHEDIIYETSVTPKSYTLTLNPNGGTIQGVDGNQELTMTYNTANNNSVTKPTKNKYVFEGYYTDPEGGVIVYGSDGKHTDDSTYWSNFMFCYYSACKRWVYDGNLTLYAHYSPAPYNPTFVVSDIDLYSFSYSADEAVAYYVSTSSSTPEYSQSSSTFALDTWTTATNTGTLNTQNVSKYYIWAMNDGGVISSNYQIVYVDKIELGTNEEFIVNVKKNNSQGEVIEFTDNKAYVINGVRIYVVSTSTGECSFPSFSIVESNCHTSNDDIICVNITIDEASPYTRTMNSDLTINPTCLQTTIVIVDP